MDPVMAIGRHTGTIIQNRDKYGFIQPDAANSGDENVFVMPKGCEVFGNLVPPVGTRVTYTIVKDSKTGRMRAHDLQPEEGYLAAYVASMGGGYGAENGFGADGSFGINGHGQGTVPVDNLGLLQQGSGDDTNIFITQAMNALGGPMPPAGSRVSYDVVIDEQTGLPRADNFQISLSSGQQAAVGQALQEQMHGQGNVAWQLGASQSLGAGALGPAQFAQAATDRHTGTLVQDNGSFGFIQPDDGGENMFVMPSGCEAFGKMLPPQGTRVTYGVKLDNKSSRPRANDVRPEAPPSHALLAAVMHSAQGGPGGSWGPAAGAGKGALARVDPWSSALMGAQLPGGGGCIGSAGGLVAPPGATAQTGVMLFDTGSYGFIKPDDGTENMFVMPKGCQGFGGAFPPQGTAVAYDVVLDSKTSRPRADNVRPTRMSGTIIVDNGTFGFIKQDLGGDNMFVMPSSCKEFQGGKQLPPIGSRVSYDVGTDSKTGRPRAEHVTLLEEPQQELLFSAELRQEMNAVLGSLS